MKHLTLNSEGLDEGGCEGELACVGDDEAHAAAE
jgi:hypothetical protein